MTLVASVHPHHLYYWWRKVHTLLSNSRELAQGPRDEMRWKPTTGTALSPTAAAVDHRWLLPLSIGSTLSYTLLLFPLCAKSGTTTSIQRPKGCECGTAASRTVASCSQRHHRPCRCQRRGRRRIEWAQGAVVAEGRIADMAGKRREWRKRKDAKSPTCGSHEYFFLLYWL